jgi:hypothetical protein
MADVFDGHKRGSAWREEKLRLNNSWRANRGHPARDPQRCGWQMPMSEVCVWTIKRNLSEHLAHFSTIGDCEAF